VIRVLIVDDSALIRRLIAAALAPVLDIEIVGQARDGLEAVTMVGELDPDIVTLDIEMPRLDGLGALEKIRQTHPRLPVIMFSTLTERGAAATLEALSRGASDYVTKPSNTGSVAEGLASVRDQLVPRIRALVGMRLLTGDTPRQRRSEPVGTPPVPAAPTPPTPAVRPAPVRRSGPPQALLIGCSTGGPDALARVIADLPAGLRVPVMVVQHMPPVFTAMLAQRLDKLSPLEVREAVDGDVPVAGQVLIAPGDQHLTVVTRAGVPTVRLTSGPQENFCRPAVDVLFRTAADVYGGRVVAAVLTGMGQDGLEGARQLVAKGAHVIAQDRESSVVWGMPGAVVMAELAHEVVPLRDLSARMVRACDYSPLGT
jgi:two-component system, chemotaxis family, protein-glutamate methylesterase/glutaminase